jgi:hypothetical protein
MPALNEPTLTRPTTANITRPLSNGERPDRLAGAGSGVFENSEAGGALVMNANTIAVMRGYASESGEFDRGPSENRGET